MRILIFSVAYLPLIGGAEIAVREITKRLINWRFDMITAKIRPNLLSFEKIDNISIYRIGFGNNFDKFLLPFLGLLKAIKLEQKNHYSLTWSIMASFGGFLGLFFKYLYPKKPWLLTLQEGDSPEFIFKRVGIFRFLFKQIFQRADYLQAISSFLAHWARKMGACAPSEIVPNGVDIEKFKRQNGQTIQNLKSELKIRPEEKVIIHTGRLVKKNGLDDLIKAGQYLDFPFRILIVGQGQEEEKLKNLAKKLNLENKIIFLGQIEHNNLPKYYSLADVFVRPSLSEGLGNSFLEAMAVGLSIIGTPVGGIPDFLKDRETGLFCQVRNPKSVAQKIKEILENEPLRKTLAKNGLKLVQKKYNWDNIALKMEEVFKKMPS